MSIRPNTLAWTPEQDARLLQLWELRVPARDIGAEFNRTKNSVLGRLGRLRAKAPHDLVLKRRFSYGKGLKMNTVEPASSVYIRSCPLRWPGPKECLFPLWGKNESPWKTKGRFCEKPITRGSYCSEHYSICYRSREETRGEVELQRNHHRSKT